MNAFGHTQTRDETVKNILQDIRSVSRLLITQHSVDRLNSSMAHVLHCLHEAGPQPVPHIARKLGVGRQHVQRMANDLMERNLIVRRPNPDHQRSWIMELTSTGHFLAERHHEEAESVLENLTKTVSPDDIATCQKVLGLLKQALEAQKPANQSEYSGPSKAKPKDRPEPGPEIPTITGISAKPEAHQNKPVLSWGAGTAGGTGLNI